LPPTLQPLRKYNDFLSYTFYGLLTYQSPREKLAATLRMLATEESIVSTHLQFRHGETTVQRYFPEVCCVIYEALKHQYMKVCY